MLNGASPLQPYQGSNACSQNNTPTNRTEHHNFLQYLPRHRSRSLIKISLSAITHLPYLCATFLIFNS